MSLEKLPDDSSIKIHLTMAMAMAMTGAERGASLTRKLLGLSRHQSTDAKVFSPNKFIDEVSDFLTRSLTSAVDLQKNLGADLWQINVAPGDLQDALLNLALNARDAMPQGGVLLIETRNKVLDEMYVHQNPGCRPGEYVCISVSDNGTGMSKEMQDRIFEPFFTTKPDDQGTGLGLSMVYAFFERSGGHIKIYSELGVGTTFNLYLPRSFTEISLSAASIEPKEYLPRGAEKVLIVDDELALALAQVAKIYLEQLGYRTVHANNAALALQILQQDTEIRLLFSDVIIPGDLDGYKIALAAHKLLPGLKILMTSGYTKKREEYVNGQREFVSKLTSNLLSKPYNLKELASSIRRTLDC